MIGILPQAPTPASSSPMAETKPVKAGDMEASWPPVMLYGKDTRTERDYARYCEDEMIAK